MRFGNHKHSVPELNTTSTADISFMLLIFFLVTTSMDSEKGLSRQLPPPEKRQQVEETSVDKRVLMQMQITADNRLLVNDQPTPLKGLRRRILQHVRSLGSRHLLSIKCDPAARYDTYFALQNEIVAAYNAWRDEKAQTRYHKRYAQLPAAQREEINSLCPQRIAEQYDGLQKGGEAQ